MVDQTTVEDEAVADELDEELLPGGPEPSSERTDQEAVAKLETVTPTVEGDAWVEPEKKAGPRPRRRPPANIGEPILELPVTLKLWSIGRGIANVTATLVFDLDHPEGDIIDFMGEHAYAAVFKGDYLGEGIVIKEAPPSVDAENNVKQKMKVTLPRWNQGTDQIGVYLVPLWPSPDTNLGNLLDQDVSWRLNANLNTPGLLQFFALQQAFDLTKRADDTPTIDELLPTS